MINNYNMIDFSKEIRCRTFDFKGKSTRYDFFNTLLMFQILFGIVSYFGKIPSLTFILIVQILIIPVTIRRLRDMGAPTNVCFIYLIPILGFLWMLSFCSKEKVEDPGILHNMIDLVKNRYAKYRGNATAYEFYSFFVPIKIVNNVLGFYLVSHESTSILFTVLLVIYILIIVLTTIPVICVSARRLRTVELPSLLTLANLVPVFGGPFMIIFCA